MNSNFEKIQAFTATWEGGLSDHPSDPGGITNHGVSLRWLQELEREARQEFARAAATCDGSNPWDSPHDFNHDGEVDAADIRACTRADAARLMKRHFWDPLHCGELPAPLGAVLYDCAVNTGSSRSVRIVQEACNVVGEANLDEFIPLRVDGKCGPKTIAMARALGEAGLDFYTARLAVRERRNFYTRLARQRQELGVFLKGWTNRCAALLDFLAVMEREV